ncbi:MAG: PA14 domain-containing protein, partial [Bacteroidota bacterium]
MCIVQQWGSAQSGICDPSTPFEQADLSSDPSSSWISSNVMRSGTCCGGSTSGCVEFELTLHPNAIGIQFDILSGTSASGNYEVNCGTPTPLGDQICLNGTGPHTVTFCNTTGGFNTYFIQSIASTILTADATVREGCDQQLNVTGVDPTTIVWNDITSGTGAYNSYLSCTSACDDPTINVPAGGPTVIEYQVCGDVDPLFCTGTSPTLCDTLTVTVTPAFVASVSPSPAIACINSGATTLPTISVLTSEPTYTYNYTWYSGPNATGAIVSTSSTYTPLGVGTYSVIIEDAIYGACTRQLFNIDAYFANCVEDCNNETDDDGDGLIDSFDPDCPCDEEEFFGQCDPDCQYTPTTPPTFDIAQEWQSDSAVITLAPMVAGDLDGDGMTEIVAVKATPAGTWSQANNIMIFDGATGALKYRPNTLNILYKNKGMAIADADRDGRGEIYYLIAYEAGATLRRRIACYEYNPSLTNPAGTGTGSFALVWTSDNQVTCGLGSGEVDNVDAFSVSVTDFNYDGIPEVVVGNEIYNATNGRRIATGGANSIGSLVDDYSVHAHPHAYSVAADVLPDAACTDCSGLELIAGNQVYAVNIVSGTMTVVRTAPSGLGDGMTSLVDYDLDGDLDAVVTSINSTNSYLYIWDLQTATQIGNTHTITTTSWDYRSASNATIADFDGDGRPEIGVCGNYVFQVVDDYTVDISGVGGVLWSISTTDRSGMTGATAFDFNADGVVEVIYRDESNVRIISGPTGADLGTFACGSTTASEYPIVIDVDNDDQAEIVCSCSPTTYGRNGNLTAFGSNNFPWVPTRQLWNQYPYFITNINDDLTVPFEQQSHHLVGSPAAGTSGRLNSYLRQVGPFDNNGDPFYPAADLEAEILTALAPNCQNLDQIDVTIKFRNVGNGTIPSGNEFTVYLGDPQNTGALVLGVYSLNSSITVNDSLNQTITVAVPFGYLPFDLYVVGSDNGTTAIPFDLSTDFPNTTLIECDYTNNIDDIALDTCMLSNDSIAPVFTDLPPNLTVNCGTVVDITGPTMTDNCDLNLTTTISLDTINSVCSKFVRREWTATDNCGNTTSYIQTIRLNDVEAPTFSGVPADVTVSCTNIPEPPEIGVPTDSIQNLALNGTATQSSTGFGGVASRAIDGNTDGDFFNGSTTFANAGTNPWWQVDLGALNYITNLEIYNRADCCENNFRNFFIFISDAPFTSNDPDVLLYDPNVNAQYILDTVAFPSAFTINATGRYVRIQLKDNGPLSIAELRVIGGNGGITAGDDCDETVNVSFSEVQNGSGCNYDILRTWTATDNCGNISSASQIITVQDDTPPVFEPLPDITISCTDTAAVAPLAVDSCGNNATVTLVSTVQTNVQLCSYDLERTWRAVDDCGNSVVVTQNIRVLDDQDPLIVRAYHVNAPGDTTFVSIRDTILTCGDVVPKVPDVDVRDGCSNSILFGYNETVTGTNYCDSTIVRSWELLDECGNDTTITQTIAFRDTTPPVITGVPADISIDCTDCIQSFLNGDMETPDLPGAWAYVNANDIPGWSTTATNNVIEFQSSGAIDGVASYGGNQHAELNGTQNSDLYQEFCTIPTTTLQISFAHHKRMGGINTSDDIMEVFIGPNLGTLTSMGTYTATGTSGWTVHNVSYVVPAGQTNTVFLFRAIQGAPGNITYGNLIDEINVVTLFNPPFIPSATDECDSFVELELSESREEGTCGENFRLTRSWTATDDCGNQTVETQVLTVGDLEPPVITGVPPDTMIISCDSIPDTNSSVVITDNCTSAVTITYNEVGGGGCEYVITRTWTAQDDCNNVTDTSQVLVVRDTTPPVLNGVPADITIACSNIPNAPTVTASDNCFTAGPVTFTENYIADGCDNNYSIERIWSSIDDCGNEARDTQTITVFNTTLPVFAGVPADTILPCGASLPTPPIVTATDGCGNFAIVFVNDVQSGSGCSYTVTRTWTAVDDCGLINTTSQLLSLSDDVTGPSFTIPNDTTIACSDLMAAVTPTVTDNCTADPSISLEEFRNFAACPQVLTRTWTATDDCGNETVQVQTIYLACECCENGIDDDGDGLVDGNDPECPCVSGSSSLTCDTMSFYYIPPVWQTNGGSFNNPSSLVISTSSASANVNVRTPDGTTFNQNYTVVNGTATVINLNINLLQTPNENTAELDRGFIVEADNPVQVLYRLDAQNNKLLVTVKGEQALGRAFRTASQTKTCGNANTGVRENHFISVMAVEDNTQVRFEFTAQMAGGLTSPHIITLNAGETYLVRDDNVNETITGSLVFADKPVAVLSGSQHTRVCNSSGLDGGVDQLVPTCLMGSNYVVNRGDGPDYQNYAIIVAIENNTPIYIDGSTTPDTILNAGEYYEYDIPGAYGDPHYISSDKAIYVYHVSGIASGKAEVGMALAAPIGNCSGDRYVEFFKFAGGDDHAAYVIIPNTGLASLTLNGNPYTTYTTAVPIPGLPTHSSVIFFEADLANQNIIESDEYMHAALLVGNSPSGTFGYLTSFQDQILVVDPDDNLPTTAYFLDTLCQGDAVSHCIDAFSCAGAHYITSITETSGTGAAVQTSSLCFDYVAPSTFNGLDEVTIVIENDNGIEQAICLQFFVCSGNPSFTNIPADTIIGCDNPLPPRVDPDILYDCDPYYVLDYQEQIFGITDRCLGYFLTRTWTISDTCGNSSTAQQRIIIRDDIAPTITIDDGGTLSTADTCACLGNAGELYREYWDGISGTDIDDLIDGTNNFTLAPTSTSILNTFQGPNNIGSDYGTRVRGYISPTETGNHTFNLTGDDDNYLYFNPQGCDADGIELIAYYDGWTNVTEHTKYTTQTSATFFLEAGRYYYIELLQKEGSGGDHFQVYWQTPSITSWTIIPGTEFFGHNAGCTYRNQDCVGGTDGELTIERYSISGTSEISDLLDDPNYPANPSFTGTINSFQGPVNVDNNFGTRVRGHIVPSETGNYLFNVTADDYIHLYLSTDETAENATRIAYADTYTGPTDHTTVASQTSVSIPLVAGNEYYVEMYHLDAGGGDFFNVYWQTPSSSTWTIVPGANLSNIGDDCSSPDNTVDCGASPPTAPSYTIVDNCDNNPTISVTSGVSGSGCTLVYEFYYEAEDNCGNVARDTSRITVEDSDAPVFDSLPADITVLCSDINTNIPTITATDFCDGSITATYTDVTTNNGCDDIVTRTWTVSDNCGNTATHDQILTIGSSFDAGPAPIADINCGDPFPVQETLTASDCGGAVIVTQSIDPYTVDICNGYSVTYRWSVSNGCGTTIDTSQSFNILPDNTPPVFDSLPAVIADVSCGDPLPTPEALTATDACNVNSGTMTILDSIPLGIGGNADYIWGETDCNLATGTQTLNITIPGDISCYSNIFLEIGMASDGNLDYNGGGSVSDWVDINILYDGLTDHVDNANPDYCLTGNFDATKTVGGESSCSCDWGMLTPHCTGNWTDCTGNLQPDVLVFPKNITPLTNSIAIQFEYRVTNSGSGSCEDPCDELIQAQYVLIKGIAGNCTAATVTPSVDPYVVDECNGYDVTYRWTAEDDCGNTTDVTQTFSVLPDNTAPSFDALPTAIADVSCGDPLPTQQTLTATDDCTTATVTPSVDAYTVDECNGYDITYRWAVEDDCGNSTDITRTFSVLPNNTAPSYSAFYIDTTLITGGSADAHVLSNSDEMMKGSVSGITESWTTVNFPATFNTTPVVFAQCVTYGDFYPVTARVRNITTTSFEVRLQEEEAYNGTNDHGAETVHWVAVEQGSQTSNFRFECDETGNVVTHNWSTVNFGQSYSSNPIVIAESQSFNGGDPFTLRYQNLTSSSVEISVDEEESNDTETDHTTEDIGYAVFNAAGETLYNDQNQVIGEVGSTTFQQDNSSSWTTVNLSRSYTNPVIVTGPISYNNTEPATVRIRNVSANSFQIQIDEWDYQNGFHPTETIPYMVVDDPISTTESYDTTFVSLNDSTLLCGDTIPRAPIVAGVDDCSTATVTSFTETGSNVGCDSTLTRTWTIEDACGNDATIIQVFTLPGASSATLNGVPTDVTVECDNIPSPPTVTANSTCITNPTVTYAEVVNGSGCNYTITRTWTIQDNCGNDISESQTITVEDTTPPSFTAPADITIFCDAGIPAPSNPSATDNCSGTINFTNNDVQSGTGCTYTITRTYTATDGCGNSASDDQIITIQDNADPYVTAAFYIDTTTTTGGSADAHTLSNNDEMMKGAVSGITESWTTVNFPATFSTTPVVFAQCVTYGDFYPVVARVRNITTTSFQVMIQEEEAYEGIDDHGPETVHWVAMEQGDQVSNFRYECDATGNVVDENWETINFAQTYSSSPIFIATSQSFNDDDPFTLRYRNLGSGSVQIQTDEEQSNDTGTNHDDEVIGYAVFNAAGETLYNDQNQIIGEVGSTTFQQNNSSSWTTVNLSRSYTNPVIVTGPASYNDVNPTTVRIRNVSANSFQIQLDEWDYQNGSHSTETIPFMVVDDPIATTESYDTTYVSLNDSTLLCGDTIPRAPILQVTDDCSTASITGFSEAGSNVACDSVLTRTWTIEDACGNDTIITQVFTLPATGNVMFNGVPADATVECDNIPTPPTVTASSSCVANPTVTYNEVINGSGCTYTITRTWSTTDNCGNTVSEDQTLTVEDTTPPSFTAPADITVDCNNIPTAVDPTFTDACSTAGISMGESTSGSGCTYTITRTWTATDACGNASSDSQIITVNDTSDPYIVDALRIDTMGTPAANYHEMSNSDWVMKGAATNVTHNWQTVNFAEAFNSTPIVIAQVVTTNGGEAVATRIDNVSLNGFDLRIQEEEGNDDVHVGEIVHWVAFEQGSQTSNFAYESVLTPTSVNQGWYTINFGQTFTNPVFLGHMQTYSDSDPAVLRYRNMTGTGNQVRIREERSVDNELSHSAEAVGYIAFSGTPGDVLNDNGDAVGEKGTLSINQTNSSTWQTVTLSRTYTNPVVVTGPIGWNASGFMTTRVRNVGTNSFEVQIDEWDYLNGTVGSAMDLHYLVIDDPQDNQTFDTTYVSLNDTTYQCTDIIPAAPTVTVGDDCSTATLLGFVEQRVLAGCDSLITRSWEIEDACGNNTTITQNITKSCGSNITTTLDESICDGNSYTLGSSTYTSSGTYRDTLLAANGCDSIIVLNLTVLPTSTTNLTESICDGDSYTVGTSTYTTGGTYTDVLTAANGCDSTVTLTLTILSEPTTTLTESICDGDSYTVGTSTYTTGGTYTDVLTAANGCDSIVNLTLTVLPEPTTTLTESICDGGSYTVGTSTYTTGGTYTDVLTAANGCDSTVNLTLTVLSTLTTTLTESICNGDSYTVGTSTYTTGGTYTDVLTSANGCDSTVTLTLTVLSTSTTNLNESICDGDSYTVGTSTYTTGGTYTDVLTSANGCDSTVNLTLTVRSAPTTTLTESICDGDSYTVGTSTYTISGTYTDVLTALNGCDSTITLTLTVLPTLTTTLTESICDGDSYTVGTSTYTTSGTYTDVLTASNGCDSTVTLTLTVLPTLTTTLTESICDGDS